MRRGFGLPKRVPRLHLLAAAFAACDDRRARFASADVSLPAIFGNHMVLQHDQKDRVWGWAEPGEEVTVTIAGQTQDGQGRRRRQVVGRRSTRCRPAGRTR